MRLCCSYRSSPSHRQMADEIRYSLNALSSLLDALEKYQDKILIIEILDLEKAQIAYDKIKNLAIENNNIVIDCYNIHDYEILSEEPALHGKLMCHYPVNNYTDMRRILYNTPYAITIGEPLTFDLAKVRQAIDRMNSDFKIKIRVVPTIGRPTEWLMVADKDDGLKHFWITPNTVNIFEDFIDVLDLYDEDPHREEALLTVFNKQMYVMPLGSLIKNIQNDIPAHMFDETFMTHRLNCHQVCMRDPSLCSYCDNYNKLLQTTRPKTASLIDFLKKE